jgi:hypothetical protein
LSVKLINLFSLFYGLPESVKQTAGTPKKSRFSVGISDILIGGSAGIT